MDKYARGRNLPDVVRFILKEGWGKGLVAAILDRYDNHSRREKMQIAEFTVLSGRRVRGDFKTCIGQGFRGLQRCYIELIINNSVIRITLI